jgi:hypothetical protein
MMDANLKNLIFGSKSAGALFPEIVAGRTLVIYGYGGAYRTFDQFVLQRYGLKPQWVVDRCFERESATPGHIGPEAFFRAFSGRPKSDVQVVVAIGSPVVFAEVRGRFANEGFGSVLSILDVYEYNIVYGQQGLEHTLRSRLEQDKDRIAAAYALLADEESRGIFVEVIRCHHAREPYRSRQYDYEQQYVVPGIGLTERDIVLLDCGAYDGDTLRKFVRSYGGLRMAVALECDLMNYSRLVSQPFPGIDKLVALPIGSGETLRQATLSASEDMLSRVVAESGHETSFAIMVSCDQAFSGIAFNRVVIDTEGYEAQTLRGMRRIMENYSPDLAVAAYHYPTDIYELIELIHALNRKYRFRLRNHSANVIDTVLYALAGEA